MHTSEKSALGGVSRKKKGKNEHKGGKEKRKKRHLGKENVPRLVRGKKGKFLRGKKREINLTS